MATSTWTAAKALTLEAKEIAQELATDGTKALHITKRPVLLATLKRLPFDKEAPDDWKIADIISAGDSPFVTTSSGTKVKCVTTWPVLGAATVADKNSRIAVAARVVTLLQEVEKFILLCEILEGDEPADSTTTPADTAPPINRQREVNVQSHLDQWKKLGISKVYHALKEDLRPTISMLSKLEHPFGDEPLLVFLPAKFKAVTDILPLAETQSLSSVTPAAQPVTTILKAYRTWIHCCRLQADLLQKWVALHAPSSDIENFIETAFTSSEWGSAAIAGKRRSVEAPSNSRQGSEALRGTEDLPRRVTFADRDSLGEHRRLDRLTEGIPPGAEAPAASGAFALGMHTSVVPATGLFRGVDLAINAATDASEPIDTYKITSEGVIPQVSAEYPSLSAFITAETERLRNLPVSQSASFSQYFRWMCEEANLMSWDFLKQWDKSVRLRIKDGRLPSFDPVTFGTQYVQFQRNWTLEPRNKNKTLHTWMPASQSDAVTDPNSPYSTRPSKRQRQRLRQQQPARPQQNPKPNPKKQPATEEREACRNWAANGTCKFGEKCRFAWSHT